MARATPAPLATALVALCLLITTVAGCSSDDTNGERSGETSGECPEWPTCEPTGAAVEATNAATGVCGVLVEFAHLVADEVNAASRQITLNTDPAVARQLLLEATENIRAAATALPEDYAALGLSEDGDIGQLVDDASAASEAVTEQLDAITAELTDGLEGEGPRQILSATFIDMEKVQSLSQPDQGDYDDPDLVAALDTEESCEHSISR